MKTGCGSVWLERCLREAEVASSNLVTPIKKCLGNKAFFVAYITPRTICDKYQNVIVSGASVKELNVAVAFFK